jgi:hypothetical protein
MTFAKKLYLIAAGAVIVLSAGSAFAQNYGGPGEGKYQSTHPSDPEEEAKRKPVDDNYKRLMERIPDSKQSYDPWGNMRSNATKSSKQRNEVK